MKTTADHKEMTPPRITVVGVGGMGIQALDQMDVSPTSSLLRLAVDTDQSMLAGSHAEQRLQIGAGHTRGHGTGGETDLGRRSAQAEFGKIRECFMNADLVLLVAGLGGGTGGGAAPVIAQTARDEGALVISVAALPFPFEGQERMHQAEQALKRLRQASQAVVVMPNQYVIEQGKDQPVAQSLQQSAMQIGAGFQLLWRLLGQRNLINLDFINLKHMVETSGGLCSFIHAEAAGRHKAKLALDRVMNHPAIQAQAVLSEASGWLIGLLGGEDLTLHEVHTIMHTVGDAVHANARRYMGVGIDPGMGNRLAIALLVGGKAEAVPSAPPAEDPVQARKPVLTDRARKRIEQKELDLVETYSKGRFKGVEPTIYEGEDLDLPTFIRRGMRLTR